MDQKWVSLLKWRDMHSDLFKYMSELGKKYKKDTGRSLYFKGNKGGFSELGYYE
jgi:hypothetical protein